MMSLFSSFDIGLSFLPIIYLLMMMTMFKLNCYKMNKTEKTMNMIKILLIKSIQSLKPKMLPKTFSMLMICLFLLIFYSNFASILPYNFPINTQISPILMMSTMTWLSINMLTMLNNTKGFLIHTIPEGTPMMLTMFLFMIEIISNFIRPITLMVRLMANIMAGHLLMTLIYVMLIEKYSLTFPLHTMLNMVEFFVALIQSYIFITMISLYYSET